MTFHHAYFLSVICFFKISVRLNIKNVYLTMNITPAKTRANTKREATTIPAVAPDGKSASKTWIQ